MIPDPREDELVSFDSVYILLKVNGADNRYKGTFTIHNVSNASVAVKTKCNHNDDYSIRPKLFELKPGNSEEIKVFTKGDYDSVFLIYILGRTRSRQPSISN